ncbi:hypothetical protein SCANM63S_08680 [Streptomyces canarius]
MIGSYVAVGDSFTEGVGDPGPDGAFVGWADRFAVLLADRRPEGDFQYTNLAVRGKLLDQIVADQVPQAIGLAPDLIPSARAATTSSAPAPTPTRWPSASNAPSPG